MVNIHTNKGDYMVTDSKIGLDELRSLPAVQELEHYAKLLALGGFSDPDGEVYNELCYYFSEIIRKHCYNIGVFVHSHWGEDGSFSIYLADNSETAWLDGPIIADCLIGIK